MGKDAFGSNRFGCTRCACSGYLSALESMDGEERDALELSRNTLTCQRKSELVLWCGCGHAAWDHASTPEGAAIAARGRSHDASDIDELATLLRSAELIRLVEPLRKAGSTLEVMYEMLEASGRLEVLAALKAAGVDALSDRQAVVNACGKARRAVRGTIGAPTEHGTCFDDAAFPAAWPFCARDVRREEEEEEEEAKQDPAVWTSAPFLQYLREATASLDTYCAGWLHDGGAHLAVGEHLADLNAAKTLPFGDEAFDALSCAAGLEYLTSPREALAECNRVLKPGGRMRVLCSGAGCAFRTKATAAWRDADDAGRRCIAAALFH